MPWREAPEEEVVRCVADKTTMEFLQVELPNLGLRLEEPEAYEAGMSVLRKIINNAEYETFRIVKDGTIFYTFEVRLTPWSSWEFLRALDYDDQILEEEYPLPVVRSIFPLL